VLSLKRHVGRTKSFRKNKGKQETIWRGGLPDPYEKGMGVSTLLLHHRSGTYWIAWGMIATFTLSVVNTWVLLVEILR
jgi:hypothetical protein